jgi:hypothetical protein
LNEKGDVGKKRVETVGLNREGVQVERGKPQVVFLNGLINL